jgi:hypothetical protein
MEDVGICKGYLVFLRAFWSILRQFGIDSGQLQFFMIIW